MVAYEIPVHEYLKTLLSKKKKIRFRCKKERENENAVESGPILTTKRKRKRVVYVKSKAEAYTVCRTNEKRTINIDTGKKTVKGCVKGSRI